MVDLAGRRRWRLRNRRRQRNAAGGDAPADRARYARRTAEECAAIVEAVEAVLRELLTLEGQPILVTTQPFRA